MTKDQTHINPPHPELDYLLLYAYQKAKDTNYVGMRLGLEQYLKALNDYGIFEQMRRQYESHEERITAIFTKYANIRLSELEDEAMKIALGQKEANQLKKLETIIAQYQKLCEQTGEKDTRYITRSDAYLDIYKAKKLKDLLPLGIKIKTSTRKIKMIISKTLFSHK